MFRTNSLLVTEPAEEALPMEEPFEETMPDCLDSLTIAGDNKFLSVLTTLLTVSYSGSSSEFLSTNFGNVNVEGNRFHVLFLDTSSLQGKDGMK